MGIMMMVNPHETTVSDQTLALEVPKLTYRNQTDVVPDAHNHIWPARMLPDKKRILALGKSLDLVATRLKNLSQPVDAHFIRTAASLFTNRTGAARWAKLPVPGYVSTKFGTSNGPNFRYRSVKFSLHGALPAIEEDVPKLPRVTAIVDLIHRRFPGMGVEGAVHRPRSFR
jgi:hypothetical protein